MGKTNLNSIYSDQQGVPRPASNGIKTRIMRRVYAIWMLRKATSPRVMKFLILIASVWQFKENVFVSKVFENMPSLVNVPATYSFFSVALMNTHLVVQASILAGAVFALLLVQDLRRREATYWF